MNKKNIIKSKNLVTAYWVFYSQDGPKGLESELKDDHCGKWMYFFKDYDFIADICKEAIEREIVTSCKHSNDTEGVSCFYINDFDREAHKRVISFFLEKGLIAKTKAGKYYNISFKLDKQTRAGEYRSDFKPTIKLEEFLNLNTGEFL